MKRILVTGGNKGIGLSIVEGILAQEADAFVLLGSRDADRGREAAARLVEASPNYAGRIEVVALDVGSDRSVAEAAKAIGSEKLYAVVNNAGVSKGDLATILETNTVGVHRVCEAFVPNLENGGRVVNVTSAAGPSFVAKCSPERQRFFLDPNATWSGLRALIDECLAIAGDAAAFAKKGLADGGPYGLSKACTNTYTLIVAREHPKLHVNACTPGFIATDMTRHYLEAEGKSAAELGMKSPKEGAKAPLHLLFGSLEGNGRYYGSDAKRSPLDAYRAPGAPEHTGP